MKSSKRCEDAPADGKGGSSPEPLQIHILGIGEITTTIEIKGPHWRKLHPVEKRLMKLAYKRMPAFADRESRDHYLAVHGRYQELIESLGIPVPWHDNLSYRRQDGKYVVYNRQERLPTNQVACLVIHDLGREQNIALFTRLLALMGPLFRHNLQNPGLLIGFDAQIPNWVLVDYDPQNPRVREDEPVVYIDTSTPLVREHGKELLDTELFLKSVPALFRPLLRLTVLDHILDRYYEPREVILDLIASYLTHGRPELVPDLVGQANRFMAGSEFARDQKPFTEREIKSYNRQDVAIWKVFRALKRMDRFIGERFMGKTYEQRLPKGSPDTWKNLVGAGGQGLSRE